MWKDFKKGGDIEEDRFETDYGKSYRSKSFRKEDVF
jgi:hypothetical protein